MKSGTIFRQVEMEVMSLFCLALLGVVFKRGFSENGTMSIGVLFAFSKPVESLLAPGSLRPSIWPFSQTRAKYHFHDLNLRVFQNIEEGVEVLGVLGFVLDLFRQHIY